jgi:hypothetical protein
MGLRNWREQNEDLARRLAMAMGLHVLLGSSSLLGTLPDCLVSSLTDNNKVGS